MKKLYNEFFYVPKYGKVKEKIMLIRTAMTVMIMVVCLSAMSFTAYAYFSHNVTSGSNIIKAAHFEAQITINDGAVELTKDGKYQVAALEAGKEYSVTLAAPTAPGSAKTGFCVITYEGGQTIYHTQQLGTDESIADGETPFIKFTLTVSQNAKVFFLSHWGTSSSYDPYSANKDKAELYVRNDDKVNIIVVSSTSGISDSAGEKDVTSGETTSQETTSGETTDSVTTPTELVYTVQSGDTLSGIAKQYGTTVPKLAAYNKIVDPSKIVTGQKIIIPPEDYEVPADTVTTETITTPETTVPAETTTSETTETTGTTGTVESTEPNESLTDESEPPETQPTTESIEPGTTGTEPVHETAV